MPIGAAIGGAAISAGGAIAGGALSSSAQKKAAAKAADTSAANADKNNALLRETRDINIGLADPFYSRGNAAGNALNDLLFGTNLYRPEQASGGAANGALSAYGGGGNSQWNAYLSANPDVAAEAQRVTADGEFGSPAEYAAWHYQHYGQAEGRQVPSTSQPVAAADTSGTPATGGGALDAFDRFRQGTNYQWRYNQGLNANRSQFATKGALDSGAAIKSAEVYGQNIASGELSNYMNLLASQQAAGLSAAGAVMGVNTSYAGNVTAQNTNASNNAANASLMAGQANANMWGTVGNAAGQVGGALFQYGMGQMQQPQVPSASSINVTPNQGTQYINVGRGF